VVCRKMEFSKAELASVTSLEAQNIDAPQNSDLPLPFLPPSGVYPTYRHEMSKKGAPVAQDALSFSSLIGGSGAVVHIEFNR
jgi:hypothetical protein